LCQRCRVITKPRRAERNPLVILNAWIVYALACLRALTRK
jgi:hypothetical protein